MLAYSDSVTKNGKSQLIMSSNSEPTAQTFNDTQNNLRSEKIEYAQDSFVIFKSDASMSVGHQMSPFLL